MKDIDRSVELLKTLRGGRNQGGVTGLKIVRIDATEPDPVTLVFEGTKLALGMEIFEIPVDCYPLRKGDRFLAYPLVGQEASQRWGVLQKLNGGVVLATMTGPDSLQIDGITKEYGPADLVIPPYFVVGNSQSTFTDTEGKTSDAYLRGDNQVVRPLQAGDTVSIAPTWDAAAGKIKYVILERYA